MTWGYTRPASSSYAVKVSADRGMRIGPVASYPGAGDVHGIQFVLDCPPRDEPRLQKLQVIWADLLAAADADTARRLGHDAAMDPHAPRLYIRTGEDGTGGFAVTVEQLMRERAIWVPSYDIYIAAGEPFVDFSTHMTQLKPWLGQTILQQIEKEPEATYEQYTTRWEDMGSPLYTNPQQTGAGHIIGLGWDSGIHKFGIDRGSGVRNDLGNPDRFRFWFEFGDITKGIAQTWKSQRLLDGLPVVITVFERDQVRYEVEQFAYPLEGPPNQRRGEIRMVLLQRLRLSSLDGTARRVPVTLESASSHERRIEHRLRCATERPHHHGQEQWFRPDSARGGWRRRRGRLVRSA